jgi:hypothetical protein
MNSYKWKFITFFDKLLFFCSSLLNCKGVSMNLNKVSKCSKNVLSRSKEFKRKGQLKWRKIEKKLKVKEKLINRFYLKTTIIQQTGIILNLLIVTLAFLLLLFSKLTII